MSSVHPEKNFSSFCFEIVSNILFFSARCERDTVPETNCSLNDMIIMSLEFRKKPRISKMTDSPTNALLQN